MNCMPLRVIWMLRRPPSSVQAHAHHYRTDMEQTPPREFLRRPTPQKPNCMENNASLTSHGRLVRLLACLVTVYPTIADFSLPFLNVSKTSRDLANGTLMILKRPL